MTSHVELYSVHIRTAIRPELSYWLVEFMRNVLIKGGWHIDNIRPVADGYVAQMYREGSVTAVLVIKAIAWVLAIAGITIIAIQMTKLNDNATIQATSSDIARSVNDVTTYCAQAGLSAEECQTMITAIQSLYDAGVPEPTPSGGLLGLGTGALLGAVIIFAIMSRSK